MALTKSGSTQPNAGDGTYNAPKPRINQIDQTPFKAPSSDGELPDGGASSALWDFMDRPSTTLNG
jgi:hypothetical protein